MSGDDRMMRTQQDLELQAARIRKDPSFNPEKTVEEVFGRQEDWILDIGSYRLMLLPFNLQWLWYDRIHEVWDDTGYNAGEVVFEIRNGELTPQRKNRPQPPDGEEKTSSAHAGFCTHCGNPLTPGKKFCGGCGAPQESPGAGIPPHFCSACGGPLTPQKAFCGACGRKTGP